jgi:hypothetical protein
MIQGETRIVRHTETGDSAFTFDETPTLAVTYPDGTSAAPTVTVSPGTSSVTQTLSATVVFSQAGIYRLAWSLDVGAQDPIIRIEEYFAAWSDVYTNVRELLDRTVTQLTDSRIDRELSRLTRWLTAQFPCIGSYGELTGDERYIFDDALAYFLAGRIRPTLGATSTGEVKRKKQGDLEIEYASGTSSTSANIVTDWERSGWEILRGIACIGYTTPLDRARSGSMMPTSILSPLGGYEDAEEYATLRGLS